MDTPFISLCPEVTRENALTLIDWLNDENVTEYLSDSHSTSQEIVQVIERVNLPVLTHIFSQSGRFYMAYDKQGVPVGFVRLVKNGTEYEIVLVIGETSRWGKKFGTAAIRESMKIAFLQLRADKVTAKIRKENIRSLRAFKNAGFLPETETADLIIFSVTMERYLQLLKGEIAMSAEIYITATDKERIKKLLDKLIEKKSSGDAVQKLETELNRAVVVNPEQVAPDVITMNSKAVLQLDGEDVEVSLVYPDEADLSMMNISVFSPIGMAILGYREGSTVEWEVPSGTSKIQIKKLLYQPEAAGDFHL